MAPPPCGSSGPTSTSTRRSSEARLASWSASSAGRANAAWRLRQLEPLATEGIDAAEMSRLVKQLEADGASFEGADASFALLVRGGGPTTGRRSGSSTSPSSSSAATAPSHAPRRASRSRSTARCCTRRQMATGRFTRSTWRSARRSGAFYPALDGVHLVDYKVRIIDGDAATAARTRVIIETGHQSGTWITAGADANIIAASLAALHDSFEYAIWQLDARPRTPRRARLVAARAR